MGMKILEELLQMGKEMYMFMDYTTSNTTFDDPIIIKYSSEGETLWIQTYDAPSNDRDVQFALDNNLNVYATGSTFNQTNLYDIFLIKYAQDLPLKITNPVSGIKWIAGEKDTVKWTGGKAGQFLEIVYSEDNGSTYNIIDTATPADSGYFIWNLPDNILNNKSKN